MIHDNLKRKSKRIRVVKADNDNNTFIQNNERPIMGMPFSDWVINKKTNPPQPINIVIVSWHILPAIDKETDLSLFPSLT